MATVTPTAEAWEAFARRNDVSVFRKIYEFWVSMTPAELILYGALTFVVLFGLVRFVLAVKARREEMRRQQAKVRERLEEARKQGQRFEVQLLKDGKNTFVSTVLRDVGKSLVLEASNAVEGQTIGSHVEVFFRVRDEEMGTVYHKIWCPVQTFSPGPRARFVLGMPTGLKEGQKRTFFRIRPMPRTVRVLALWSLGDDEPLPQHTDAIGQPMFSFTNEMRLIAPEVIDDETYKAAFEEEDGSELYIPLEDISGSGIGLRVPQPEEEVTVGQRLICLLIYNETETMVNLVTFWCEGIVVNVREPKDDPGFVILGLEFKHWAVLKQGRKDITWFQSSSAAGAGPVTQWVVKQNLDQNKGKK